MDTNFSGIANGDQIEYFIDKGFIKGAKKENINAGSLDLTLNSDILTLKGNEIINLSKKEKPELLLLKRHSDGYFWITPGMFFLASTKEEFNLPDFICTSVYLRSSIARVGIDHLMAGWADAGFTGSNLTLEFINNTTNTYLIKEDNCYVQIVFHLMNSVSDRYNYKTKGRYNNKKGTVISKSI
jgi:dCTP deaminase